VNPATRVALGVIVGYQRLISPFIPSACRFAPTCSEYARLALVEHGVLRGIALAVWRLARCHPFHPGGYDPPPVRARQV
jgi:putative membrane protein insertion efficiency factor